jgi:hypothetical protein
MHASHAPFYLNVLSDEPFSMNLYKPKQRMLTGTVTRILVETGRMRKQLTMGVQLNL